VSDSASKGSILVIDDSEPIRGLLERLLEKHGYRVLTASGGKQGLQAAYEFEPDLIILDIMMDDMDGTEVGGKLREAPRTAGIPIIYLTGLMTAEEGARTLGQSGDVVVAKPFDAQDLLSRVESLI
jgi:DNA-binding response OmpR family regulator